MIIKNEHICFISNINPLLRPGGAEIQTLNWMEMFAKDNYKVSLITEKRGMKVKDSRFVIRYVPARRIFNIYQSIMLFLQLIRLNPDICYQRLKNEFTFVVGLYSKIFQKKFIWWCSSDKQLITNSYYIYAKSKYQRFSLKHKLGLLDGKITSLISDKGLKMANLIVCQNKRQMSLANNFSEKYIQINNSFLWDDNEDSYSKKNKIIWIGNFKKVKRLDLFIDLIKLINRQDIEYILIGEPDNFYYDMIEKFKKNNKYKIKILGKLSYKEVHFHLSESKILVNTSDSEGFSNTFIEAWKNGTKVISFNSNPNDMLKGVFGFQSNDIKALVNKIHECINHEISEKDVLEMQEYVNKNHNIKRNYLKLVNVIKRI